MNDFTFYSPTEFVFGKGVTDGVGSNLADRGFKSALVVYGKGSVVRNGTLDRVKNSLAAAGLRVCELGGVRPNPEVSSVREGVAIARRQGVDVIVAVGGGSVIDCAKAIGVAYDYEGDPWDFSCKKAPITHTVPVACVLTIPAAGSEASNSCVISNDELGLKSGMGSDIIRPIAAFMDPELTFTLPAYQTAAGVTDMMAHIMERYFSGAGPVPVTDNIATGLLRAIMNAARKVLDCPTDYDARANIMWAGTLAHNGIAGIGRKHGARVGDWASHGLEHELSAFDASITHGAGLAVIMPAWMRYVYSEDVCRFAEFAYAVFGIEPEDSSDQAMDKAARDGIEALQDFFASLGMPRTLGEFGIKEADIERFIPGLRQNKGEVFGCFKQIGLDDARAIYRSAL